MDHRSTTGEHADIRLWLRLLYCASHIESALQSKLTAEFGMSLARFDLLSQLERAPNGLTMEHSSLVLGMTELHFLHLYLAYKEQKLYVSAAAPETVPPADAPKP